RGTAFEERSLKILQDDFSMSLRRVGGKSDGGVDLVGWWWLPHLDCDISLVAGPDSGSDSQRRRLRILAQCKAEKKKLGPNYVREMEGVLHRYLPPPAGLASQPGVEQHPSIALLISESPFTKATLLRAHSSPIPFFLLHIPPPPQNTDTQGGIGLAVWNPALAGVHGLLKGQFETRWERSTTGAERPGLWYRDKKVKSWTPDT
ncbi:hypothetical protein BD779DRAFT_1380633, partial [Infundibulicybe gibba]